MAACQNLAQNKNVCTCTSTDCQRHGVCCQCILYHRKNGDRPACLR